MHGTTVGQWGATVHGTTVGQWGATVHSTTVGQWGATVHSTTRKIGILDKLISQRGAYWMHQVDTPNRARARRGRGVGARLGGVQTRFLWCGCRSGGG